MTIESAEEFVRLRTSSRIEEYRRAAAEDAPVEVWTEVVRRYPEMRPWVAHNKQVPLEILRVLATDDAPDVRVTVAMKRKLDRDLFDLLARDHDEGVRRRIALNPNVPRDVFERLLNDDSGFVRETARERAGIERNGGGSSAPQVP